MKTILILDDEPLVRQSLADHFEDNLWRPVQAGSGESALELLEKERPVAAIVDIRLPGMSGDRFIRESIQRKILKAIVICTGSPEYILHPDLMEMSCVSNHLFKKPVFDLEELEKEVLRVLDRAVPERGGENG